MRRFDFDLFVIGGGSGGVRAARMSACFGARVALAEERYLGGTCVNVGCVPKKLFVYAAQFHAEFAAAEAYGWHTESHRFDWSKLLTHKNREINRLQAVYARLLDHAGVLALEGRARLLDPHTVAIGDNRYTAERILIATGSTPVVPEIPGREFCITSNDAFFLEHLPRRVIIVGGGYIAVEFAGIFAGLGVATTLVHRGDLFLRGFDDDVRTFLAAEMAGSGLTLRFRRGVGRIERHATDLVVTLDDGSTMTSDLVLVATGRRPNTHDLGLDAAGVALDGAGAVVVDDDFQSSEPSIYAIGDVINRVRLTPVALAEGMALARRLFGGDSRRVDYNGIPTAVFSHPSIGTVGLTEHEARRRHTDVTIFKTSFIALKHTLTGLNERTFIKLVVDRKTDRVLGVHMVGAEAGEIIQGIAIALKAGATKAIFDATIGIHPTTAEELVTLREPEP